MSDDTRLLPVYNEARDLYGQFWYRAAAFLVDFALFCIPVLLIMRLFHLTWADFPVFAGVFVLAAAFYCVPFEASRLQATPGKWLLGLQVTDLHGGRISLRQTLIRYFGKMLSTLILGIGFQLMEWSKRRQTLHDRLAGTCVVQKRRLLALRESRELNTSEKFAGMAHSMLVVVVFLGVVAAAAYTTYMPRSRSHLLRGFCEAMPKDMTRAQLLRYAQDNGYTFGQLSSDPDQAWLYNPGVLGQDRCLMQFRAGKLESAVYRPAY